jgi:hypothetical protein
VRWANLAHILTLRRLSTEIARRFPTFNHLVDAGLLTEKELIKLDKIIETTDSLYPIHWVPLSWAQVEIRKAKENGYISSDAIFKELQQSLTDLEGKNRLLLGYGWMNIPLVYTQLVTIAVYVYFFVTLLGRQYLTPTRYIAENGFFRKVGHGTPNSVNLVGHDDASLDFYIPFFTILQFIFYVGWLKVAEILINPFGDDDDDFDVNFIIDGNFQTSYLMVDGDDSADTDNELEDDTYGNNIPPTTLPHTVESFKFKEPPPAMPTDNFVVPEDNPIHEGKVDPSFLFLPDRKLSIKSCSLPWYNRRASLRSCGRRGIQRRKQNLHFQRSISGVALEESTSPMIVIHDANPNIEMKQKNFTLPSSEI